MQIISTHSNSFESGIYDFRTPIEGVALVGTRLDFSENPDSMICGKKPINTRFYFIYFVLRHQASSHNILSVIFGILRKFCLGICSYFFTIGKMFVEKKLIENFPGKFLENFSIKIFSTKIFPIIKKRRTYSEPKIAQDSKNHTYNIVR